MHGFAMVTFCLKSGFLSLFLLAMLLFGSPAHADRASYYAPPSNISVGLQIGYSDKFSQDYINLNANPAARFSTATASLHYDQKKNTISNLRVSVSSGSITTPDKDFTWILMGPGALNINDFEEITLFSAQAAAFDHENKAILDGYMTLRGITAPAKIETKLHFVQDSNIISGTVFGDRGSIGLSLSIHFLCADFNMAPVDSNNKSRGDLGTIRMDIRAVKQ